MEGRGTPSDQMFLRLELLVVWLTIWSDQPDASHASSNEVMEMKKMEVAGRQLRSFHIKLPPTNHTNEVSRSQ